MYQRDVSTYPNPDRYGGYDREEEMENVEMLLNREAHEEDEEREIVQYGGYCKDEELENAELPPVGSYKTMGNKPQQIDNPIYNLVKAHSNGEITIRQIASLTRLSPERTYEVVTAIYDHHDDLVDEGDPCR